MANQRLFRSARVPVSDAWNAHGAPAYGREGRLGLAQLVVTGCLSATFYSSDRQELALVRSLASQVSPEFVARAAVYARQRGLMKDMPALLLAHLTARRPDLLERVFDRVIDSPKMLRTYIQMVRSGAMGRKSFGTLPRRLIRQWLDGRSDEALLRASVGQSPSLVDIIRMVHPKPRTASRRALYGYLLGRPYDIAALPHLARAFEDFKAGRVAMPPDVPFEMLTSLPLTSDNWRTIAGRASWQTTRMNLNLFARNGVFGNPALTKKIAARLADRAQIERARAFPYQVMLTHAILAQDVPASIREALEAALDLSLAQVPKIDAHAQGKVYVCLDVSGSMKSPVTGHRQGATTTVRCVDVAALMAAAMVRRNPGARVLAFNDTVLPVMTDPAEPVLALAKRLAALPDGGTSCSAPLALLNREHAQGALVLYLSDNQSWVDAAHCHTGTAMLDEWQRFKRRNRAARLVRLDLQPSATTQVIEREDVMNIGGFSDQVFEMIAEFAAGRLHPTHWVGAIEAIAI